MGFPGGLVDTFEGGKSWAEMTPADKTGIAAQAQDPVPAPPLRRSRLFDVERLSRFVRIDTVWYHRARMEGQKRERWMQLAEQAAGAKDPEILLRLIAEINELLDEKEERLIRARLANKTGDAPAGSEAT